MSTELPLDPAAPDWADTPVGKWVSTLYWARVNKRIPQFDVAEALGIHGSGLSRRERGLVDVTAEELIRWADLLGYEVVLREKIAVPPMPVTTLRGQ